MNTFPRRSRLDLNEPAELAVYNAMQEVEKIGADSRLTEAVTLLAKAKDLIADFVDEQNEADPKTIQKDPLPPVPIELQKYLAKVFSEVEMVEDGVKRISQYGAAIFVVFNSDKVYRLNFQAYNSEVTLDGPGGNGA